MINISQYYHQNHTKLLITGPGRVGRRLIFGTDNNLGIQKRISLKQHLARPKQ